MTYHVSTVIITAAKIAVDRFEPCTSLPSQKRFGRLAVPATMLLFGFFHGPLARNCHSEAAMELSIMVVMTSFTLSFTFKTPGIHA